MRIEDVIRTVQHAFMSVPEISSGETIECYEIAIEALKKQEPLNATYHSGDEWTCSNCSKEVLRMEHYYCPECGQRLMWERR